MSHTPDEEGIESFQSLKDQMILLGDDSISFLGIIIEKDILDKQSLFKLKELNQQLTTRLEYIEKHYFQN